MNQVEVLETPIKLESDTCEYRYIKLSNGLRAVLVSHQPSEEGQNVEDLNAVNLSVHVGSFDDPPHILGLAHFLEHLLFMGSTKYPAGLNPTIKPNGGYANAATSTDRTDYIFTVNSNAFVEAFDIFASMFKTPLLLKEAMQKEREAVDSEFRMSQTSFGTQVHHVYMTLVKESHPASRFTCGNLKTLKEDISDDELYREVVKFFKRYTANRMCLAMHSKLSLDQMQAMVVEKFSGVKSESELPTRKLTYNLNEILKPEFYDNMITMGSGNSLRLSWAMPSSSFAKHYKTMPFLYLSILFDVSGEGSLSDYLKKLGLIDRLNFKSDREEEEFWIQQLEVSLTDEGAQNIEKILEAIFSYLLMLKETPIEEHRRLYTQFQTMFNMQLKSYDANDARQTVETITKAMREVDTADLVRPTTFQSFDENAIQEAIEVINQNRFNLFLRLKEHKPFNKKEKFTGAEYLQSDFPETYRKLWAGRKLNSELFIKKESLLAATNFEIFVNAAESPEFPVKIVEDGIFEVWHKLDDVFKTPLATVYIELLSPKVMSTIQSYHYLDIYDEMLEKDLEEDLNEANEAGLSVSIRNEEKALRLKFDGFNEKLNVIVSSTIAKLKHFNENLDQSVFETIKAKKSESSDKNGLQDQHLISSMHSSTSTQMVIDLLGTDNFPDRRHFDKIDSLTFKEFKKFVTDFYAKLKIKVLAYGNFKRSDAMEVFEIFKENLQCQPLDEPYEVSLLKPRSFQIPLGTSILRAKSLDLNDDNSTLYTILEVGEETLRSEALLRIVEQILHPRAFTYLREQEQLGYVVEIGTHSLNGIGGLTLIVQSQESKHSYVEVQQKMDNFLSQIARKTIEELSDEEFESIKSTDISNSLAALSSMSRYERMFLEEISSEEYAFDKRAQRAEVIKSLTKSDLQNFFKSIAAPENLRKLVVQKLGSHEGSANGKEDGNLITSIEDFRKNATLHPFLKFAD